MQGTIFEGYEVLEEILRDELTTIYAAVESSAGTPVDLKVLTNVTADGAKAFYRLCKRDAANVASSGKPTILKFGVSSAGQSYAVYVKGFS